MPPRTRRKANTPKKAVRSKEENKLGLETDLGKNSNETEVVDITQEPPADEDPSSQTIQIVSTSSVKADDPVHVEVDDHEQCDLVKVDLIQDEEEQPETIAEPDEGDIIQEDPLMDEEQDDAVNREINAEFEDMVERDRDPDYELPKEATRKSVRLENRGRLDYKTERRYRNPARIQEENEKRDFYKAVRKYGTKKPEEITKCLPNKTLDNVRAWIQREKVKQNYRMEQRAVRENGTYEVLDEQIRQLKSIAGTSKNENGPDDSWRENVELDQKMVRIETHSAIDEWAKIIQDSKEKTDAIRESKGLEKLIDCEGMIPNCMRWIAEFEKHPHPSKCGGIDYASIYRYFAHLAEGEVPPDLNPVTAARVTRLLTDVSSIIMGNMKENEVNFLQNYKGPFSRYTTSKDFNPKSESLKPLGELSKLPGINPLNFHPDLCSQQKIDLNKYVMAVKPDTLQKSEAIGEVDI